MAGEAVLGAETPGVDGPVQAIASVGRILRQGATAFIEAATDDRDVEALDKLAGPRWRLAAQAADVAVVAARAAVQGAEGKDEDDDAEVEAGEPTPAGTARRTRGGHAHERMRRRERRRHSLPDDSRRRGRLCLATYPGI